MKKLSLLLMSLITVSFLASCGRKKIVSHFVNEQEFNDACSLKDVQYLQLSISDTMFYELSPTVSHIISKYSITYFEQFVQKKSGGTYEKAYRYDESKDEYSFGVASKGDFLIPQHFNVELEHMGLTYNSFTYDNEAGNYSATYTSQGGGAKTTTTLKFDDKKLTRRIDVASSGEATMTITYAYENKTPKYPKNSGPTLFLIFTL